MTSSLWRLRRCAATRNGTLHELRIDLSEVTYAADAARAAPPLAELAAVLRTASALRALRLHVTVPAHDDDDEDEFPIAFYANATLIAQAWQALAAAAAATTCLVQIEATE